jgi:hypothetical protein
MRIPRKVALVGATVALLALIPASSASAYSAGEKRAEKRQNARTKKIAKDLTAVKKLVDTVKGSIPSLSEVTAKIDAVDGRLKVIEGAAPQIIQGLQKLQTLATATEYGIGQVFIGGNPEPGALVVTPDVPDAVQQAQATNQFIASQSGAITVQVAVRSAESDGTGSSLPAAHCRVTVQQLGSVATRTSSPNPGLGGAPFWPIDQKSKQTSTAAANAAFPFGPKTSGEDADVLTDLTTGANSTAPAGSPTATAGTPFSVTLACVDTSPSTDDPSA